MTLPQNIPSCGPFAEAQRNIDAFCHNLFLSYTINDCIKRLSTIEQEYEQAILSENIELAEQKRLQIKTFDNSLQLTAHIFENVDEIGS